MSQPLSPHRVRASWTYGHGVETRCGGFSPRGDRAGWWWGFVDGRVAEALASSTSTACNTNPHGEFSSYASSLHGNLYYTLELADDILLINRQAITLHHLQVGYIRRNMGIVHANTVHYNYKAGLLAKHQPHASLLYLQPYQLCASFKYHFVYSGLSSSPHTIATSPWQMESSSQASQARTNQSLGSLTA